MVVRCINTNTYNSNNLTEIKTRNIYRENARKSDHPNNFNIVTNPFTVVDFKLGIELILAFIIHTSQKSFIILKIINHNLTYKDSNKIGID